MKATTIEPQAVRRAAALLALTLAALAAHLITAPSAQAAPLPQFWTACFSEEGGSGANECDGPSGIAADPDTPGHVYVADSSNNRINEFNAWGAFVKSWGWGVRDGSLGPQTCGPEATPPSASCQRGISGPRGGQLGAGAVGVDSAGDVYVFDTGNRRIQKFGPDGSFLRAWGGGVVSGGATGTGDLNGTTTVSSLVATGKAFRVGQTVTSSDGGIPAGTTVTKFTTGPAATLTLSQPATTTNGGVTLTAAEGTGNVPTNEVQTIDLFNPTAGTFTLTVPARQGFASHTTAPIAYDAPPATVRTELEGAGGMAGNVEVTGSDGGPYQVEFKGVLADTDVAQLTASSSGFTVGAGSELRCRAGIRTGGGEFFGPPATDNVDFSYQWLANGESLGASNGAQTPIYTVQVADAGKAIQCQVITTNRIADLDFPAVHAATTEISAATVIPAVPSPLPPEPTGAIPQIGLPDGSLDGTQAKEVVCNAGGWSNSPTEYTYQLLRRGALYGPPTTTAATSASFVLNAAEQQEPAAFQCKIVAENAGGASARSSAKRLTTGDYSAQPPASDAAAELDLPAATPATSVAGASAAEICAVAAECQEGIAADGPGRFGDARGIAIDHNGTLGTAADDVVYVGGENRIQSFDSDGNHTGEIAFGGAPAPESGAVGALAVEQAGGDLYFAYESDTSIADLTGEAIQPDVYRLDPDTGEVTDTLEVAIPTAIATAPDGSVYVFDWRAPGTIAGPGNKIQRVLKFDSGGDFVEAAVKNKGPLQSDADQFTEGAVHGLATGSACFTAGSHHLYATNSGGSANVHAEFTRAWGPIPDDLIGCPRPEVPPEILDQYAVFVDDDTATVRAKINPRFWEDTAFYVQYATADCIDSEGWGGGCVAEEPAAPGTPLGAGVVTGEIETPDIVLDGLTPDTDYLYRFVAQSSGGGPVAGEGGTEAVEGAAAGFPTFPTEEPVETNCQNQSLRQGTSSELLPDCRAYEQVSPVDKNGYGVIPAPVIASRGAEVVSFVSRGAFAGTPAGAFPNAYGALRGASEWQIHPMSAPMDPVADIYTGSLYGASADTKRQLVGTTASLHPDAQAGIFNLYVHNDTTGAYDFVAEFPSINFVNFGSGATQAIKFAGASTDGSHIYFTVPGDYLLDSNPPPPLDADTNLYEYSGGQLKLVGVLPGGGVAPQGSEVGRPSGVDAPAGRAVSTDGERVYWQSQGRLYLRDGGQSTLVSERESDASAQSADFRYASAVGSFAFLTSNARLTPDASPSGTDLYRYDDAAEDLEDLTPTGSSSDVSRVLGAGENGAYAYFIAGGNLAPGAIVGEDNLYAWHEGEGVRLIGRLDAGGLGEARVSANGRYLGFTFGGEIDGPHPYVGWPENPQTDQPFTQAYLYDHTEDTLTCVSCPAADGALHGEARFHGPELGTGELNVFTADEGLSSNVSDRGELFFHTPARLVRRDQNGEGGCPLVDLRLTGFVPTQFSENEQPACMDVYVYDGPEGTVRLLSGADDSGPAFFGDASADGEDALIVTFSRLVGQDEDSHFDLYDARVEGGIAAQSAPAPVPCEGEGCRGAGTSPANVPGAGSSRFEGPGNPPPPPDCGRFSKRAKRKLAVAKKAARKGQAKRARKLRKQAHNLKRGAKRCNRRAAR